MSNNSITGISIVGGFNFFAQGIKHMLGNMPYTKDISIGIYQNGTAFLENDNKTGNVILLNIMMSDYSGPKFSEILKSKYPDNKIIIMSLKDEIDLSNCLASKADGFLSSYFNESELEFAIKTVLSGESYASSGLIVKLLREKNSKKKKSSTIGKVA